MVIILREFITVLWGRVNWLRERTLWSFWKSIRTTNQIVRRLNWLRGRRTLKNVQKLHGREVGYNILSSLLWYMCKVAQDNIISILWLVQIELLRPNQCVVSKKEVNKHTHQKNGEIKIFRSPWWSGLGTTLRIFPQ